MLACVAAQWQIAAGTGSLRHDVCTPTPHTTDDAITPQQAISTAAGSLRHCQVLQQVCDGVVMWTPSLHRMPSSALRPAGWDSMLAWSTRGPLTSTTLSAGVSLRTHRYCACSKVVRGRGVWPYHMTHVFWMPATAEAQLLEPLNHPLKPARVLRTADSISLPCPAPPAARAQAVSLTCCTSSGC
jgi:hypothetical protein